MSRYYARASARASSFAKEIEFQYFIYQNEAKYPVWWSKRRLSYWLYAAPDSTNWNIVVCIFALVTLVLMSMNYLNEFDIIDILYNALYGLHCLALLYNDYIKVKNEKLRLPKVHWVAYGFDILSFVHYARYALTGDLTTLYALKLSCYYIRLHRPFSFLLKLFDHYLQGSVFGTLLKYMYLFSVVCVIATNAFIWIGEIEDQHYDDRPDWLQMRVGRLFYKGLLDIHKLFILIGPESQPKNDTSRFFYMVVMIVGCLLLMGITIASLALMLSLHLRPEEMFRSRFHLIMNDMKESNVPIMLAKRVETFYRMYWHKQKAVSVTKLLPIFPPSLPAAIHTNIYFKALEKSRILRDLSYQFLSEIAKHMETVHYIPGDAIIRRSSPKSSIIYISYGDVEMSSAEDDETAILRFSRGTIINPCGGCIEVASTRSHVAIRAATFCTAHILKARDLWRIATKYGRNNGQSFIIHSSFEYHLERVKHHYSKRVHPSIQYKSNILLLKRNLIELKEAEGPDGKLLLKRTDVFLEIADCYIMRNCADASLTDESDEICLRPRFPCILQPYSTLLLAWQILVAFITIIVAFEHPYRLIYLKTVTTGFKFFNYMVTLIYITDIIVQLSTGANIEEGVPITFAHTSANQMKSYWFALDFLSTVPLFEIIGDGRFAGLNKLFKIPSVFRVLKRLEDLSVYQSQALRFMSYLLLIVLLTYLVAALQQGYSCFGLDKCIVENITQTPYWVQKPLDNGPVEGRLKFSWYWAISMITFTSHKTARIGHSVWESQLFVMLVLEVCTVIHIMIEATYSAAIMVTETMSDQYKTCIDLVKSFLIKNNVDPTLRQRFINYLQLCWYTDKAFAITERKTSIWYDLPSHVYQDILAMQRSKYILCVPFMKYLNNAILKDVSSHSHLFYTSPNEILLNTGDITNEIYIIKQGFCEVIDPATKTVVSLITSKNHFGDIECLLRFPAYYTVRAVTHVQICSISLKYLKAALEVPKIKDAISYAKQQQEFNLLQDRYKPFLFYETPKSPPNRERFPLPRKYESDFNFLHPFTHIGFFSILRYVFPRFTIRPDSKYLTRYEWFRAACAFLAANIYPLYSYLELQSPYLWYITLFLDLAAYFDIFQRMLVGYFDEKGILVFHPASTAVHYIKGAFTIDLLACIPLEIFDRKNIYYQNDAYRIPKSFQYFMYNRVLQLYRLPHALEILNDYIDRQDIILIIKAFPLLMCLLVIVTSLIMEYSVDKWLPADGGWILDITRDPLYGSWIEAAKGAVRYNITETPWNLVLTTYYWVIYETTTTGFNIFQPSDIRILSTLIFGMTFGAMITTYFAVKVISIRSNVNQALAAFQDDMKDIVWFMNKEKLDKKLQQNVLSYYEYNWIKTGGLNYSAIFKLCDQITLRTDAILHIYGQTFAECPILKNSDSALLRIIGREVSSLYLKETMTIVEYQDVISEMYFVDFGTVEVQDSEFNEPITKLPRGSVFGNLENEKTIVNYKIIVAKTNVHLLKIKAEVFYGIIQEIPDVKDLIKQYRPNNENFIVSNLRSQSVVHDLTKDNRFITSIKENRIFKCLQVFEKIIQRYFVLSSILSVYVDLYNAGFQNNSFSIIFIMYFLDACFIIKIILFNLQLFITDEETRTRVGDTAKKRYCTKELKFDIVSCLPIEIFALLHSNQWLMFSFLRLNRTLRVVTVSNSLKRLSQNLSINLTLITIASFFIWFTLFVHSATCLWNLIGLYEHYVEPNTSWHFNDDGTVLCNNYLCSIYFVLTTFTENGVGDILPKKQSEVLFVCILMILSTMIYMIYVGEFSNIIQYQYFRCFTYYTKCVELQEFLKNNRVSKNLGKIIKRYTLHLWQESRGLQQPQFLLNAPQCLRLQIMAAAYMKHLQQHSVFGNCEPAFLRLLVGCLKPFMYNEDMYVVKEGEITNAMYFIHTGRVVEIDEEFEEISDKFCAGQYFGWANGYQYDVPYSYSYKTNVKSQVLTLLLDDWYYLLKHFLASSQIIFQNDDHDFGQELLNELVREKRVEIMKQTVIKIEDAIEGNVTEIDAFKSPSDVKEVLFDLSPSSQMGVTSVSTNKSQQNSNVESAQTSNLEAKIPDELITIKLKTENEEKLPYIIEDITHVEEREKKIAHDNKTIQLGTHLENSSQPKLDKLNSTEPKFENHDNINKNILSTSSKITDEEEIVLKIETLSQSRNELLTPESSTLNQETTDSKKTLLQYKDSKNSNENKQLIVYKGDNSDEFGTITYSKTENIIPTTSKQANVSDTKEKDETKPLRLGDKRSKISDKKHFSIHEPEIGANSSVIDVLPVKSDSVESFEEYLMEKKLAKGIVIKDTEVANSTRSHVHYKDVSSLATLEASPKFIGLSRNESLTSNSPQHHNTESSTSVYTKPSSSKNVPEKEDEDSKKEEEK